MRGRIYALLNDAFASDQRIWLFQEKSSAEQARRCSSSQDALVVAFDAPGLHLDLIGPVFLAVTTEDDGLRIRHCSRSPINVQAFMDTAPIEGNCRWLMGWAADHAQGSTEIARRA